MGKSLIISSTNKAYIQKEIANILKKIDLASSNNSDFLEIRPIKEKSTIGIEQMKTLKYWSNSKPYKSKQKLAIIWEAEKLTPASQNSILKLLEEPNPSNNYILITSNFSKLLDTIISRCELLFNSASKLEEIDVTAFLNADLLGRMAYTDNIIKEKDSQIKLEGVRELLLGLLQFYRKKLIKGENVINAIKSINHTQGLIDANVSLRHALEYLCLNLDNLE